MLGNWDCGQNPCEEDCASFTDVLKDVLAVAYEAVCRDMPEDFCETFTGYVSVNEPVAPVGDYVATWIQNVTPYNPAQSAAGRGQAFARALAAVGVKLLETGWPMITPEGAPSFAAINGAALQATSHAERVSRALYNAVSFRSLTEHGCRFHGMGAMSPVAASGGLVGWTWAVQVEVPW